MTVKGFSEAPGEACADGWGVGWEGGGGLCIGNRILGLRRRGGWRGARWRGWRRLSYEGEEIDIYER